MYVEKRVNEIVNRLNKTKVESFPDLAQEKIQRDKLDRHAIRQKELEQVRKCFFLTNRWVVCRCISVIYYSDRTRLIEKLRLKHKKQKRRLIICLANVIWSATTERRKLRTLMLLRKISCNSKQGTR